MSDNAEQDSENSQMGIPNDLLQIIWTVAAFSLENDEFKSKLNTFFGVSKEDINALLKSKNIPPEALLSSDSICTAFHVLTIAEMIGFESEGSISQDNLSAALTKLEAHL